MPTCPVCEKTLPEALPPFCDQCGWDLKNDLTLVPTLGGIDDATIAEYRERIALARQVWNRQKMLERNLEEMGKRLDRAEQKAKEEYQHWNHWAQQQFKIIANQKSASMISLEQKLKDMERQLAEANAKGKAERQSSESPSKKIEETRAKPEKKSKEKKQNQNDTPMTVAEEDARKVFGVGAWERPKKFVKNDYRDNEDGTVTDRANGLTWQKSGSGRLNYEKAKQYVDKLNEDRFAGYTDWRLPTVTELLTLMEPRKQGWRFWKDRLYINTIFDDRQRWCWSANLCASGGAWLVNFTLGHVDPNDLDFDLYVRAVRP